MHLNNNQNFDEKDYSNYQYVNHLVSNVKVRKKLLLPLYDISGSFKRKSFYWDLTILSHFHAFNLETDFFFFLIHSQNLDVWPVVCTCASSIVSGKDGCPQDVVIFLYCRFSQNCFLLFQVEGKEETKSDLWLFFLNY